MIVGKTLLHGSQDLHFQVESLKLRCDLRGHHQTLRFTRRVAVARDHSFKCGGTLLYIRLLDRLLSLHKQQIRLKAKVRHFVRRTGQPGAGF